MSIREQGGFGPYDGNREPGGCTATLLVATDDRRGATQALREVDGRLMLVGSDGREYPDAESLEAEWENDVFSVNWVSPPAQYLRGPGIMVDFKGEDLTAPMGSAYRGVVISELERQGVRDGTLLPIDEAVMDTEDTAMFASARADSIIIEVPMIQAVRAFQDRLQTGHMLWSGPALSTELRSYLAALPEAESPFDYLGDGLTETGLRTNGVPIQIDSELFGMFVDALASIPAKYASMSVGRIWVVDGVNVAARIDSTCTRVRADIDQGLVHVLKDAGQHG